MIFIYDPFNVLCISSFDKESIGSVAYLTLIHDTLLSWNLGLHDDSYGYPFQTQLLLTLFNTALLDLILVLYVVS